MTLLNFTSVSPKARQIVLDIFRKLPPRTGLNTHQIYEKAVNEYQAETDLKHVPLPSMGTQWRNKKGKTIIAPLPPNPDHPVRSVRSYQYYTFFTTRN